MKKLLATLLLTLIPTVALAAPPCYPSMTPPQALSLTYVLEMPTTAVPDGSVVAPGDVIFAASTLGLIWGYTCIDSTGKWWKVVAGGLWDQFPRDWLYILDQAIRGPRESLPAIWDKYAVTNTFDSRLLPDVESIKAKLPNPPPVAVWKVVPDPFRADKKRLVYNVVNGKRGTPTTQYVDAGSTCDPVTTITEFGPVYFMSVLGNPNLVARCAK